MSATITEGLAFAMGEAALRSALVAAAAGAGVHLFRLRSAAQRSGVWKVALGASLTMPLLMIAAPPIFLRSAPASRAAEPAATIAPEFTLPARAPISFSPDAAVASGPDFDWLSAVYFAVAAAMLLRIVVGWMLGARLAARARPIDLGAPFETRESRDVTAPTTFGWPGAAVLLPETWKFWDEKKLRAVLLHEGAHVSRGDFVVNVVAQLNAAIFWFSPVAWFVKARLARLGEEASDDRALDSLDDNAGYAEVLLSFASRRRPELAAPLAVPMASGAAASRIERALDHRPGQSRRLGAAAKAGLAAAFAAAAYGAAAVSLAEAPVRASAAPYYLAAPVPSPAPKPAAAPKPAEAPVAPDGPELAGAPDAPTPATPPTPPTPPTPATCCDETATSWSDHERDAWSWSWKDGRQSTKIRIEGDRIDYRRNGKTWTITDPQTVAKAQDLLRSVESLNEAQEQLNAEQERLSDEQDAVSERYEDVVIDSRELQKRLKKELGELQAIAGKGRLTQEELGKMQDRLGDLQGELGALQARAGESQGARSHEIEKLAQKQAALGAKQAEIGRKIGEANARVEARINALIDEAIRDGDATLDE